MARTSPDQAVLLSQPSPEILGKSFNLPASIPRLYKCWCKPVRNVQPQRDLQKRPRVSDTAQGFAVQSCAAVRDEGAVVLLPTEVFLAPHAVQGRCRLDPQPKGRPPGALGQSCLEGRTSLGGPRPWHLHVLAEVMQKGLWGFRYLWQAFPSILPAVSDC